MLLPCFWYYTYEYGCFHLHIKIQLLKGRLCACSVVQSCPTLCDFMDCSPPGSSIYWIFWARILEWIALSFSRGSSQPKDRTCISCIGRWILLLLSHLEGGYYFGCCPLLFYETLEGRHSVLLLLFLSLSSVVIIMPDS